MSEAQFYIADLRPEWQKSRRHPYVTLWRGANSGYCYSIPWAGRYDQSCVDQNRFYYTKVVKAGSTYYVGEKPYRRDTLMRFAVTCDVVDRLAVPEPARGVIDGDVGPVLPNNAAVRKALRAAAYVPEAAP